MSYFNITHYLYIIYTVEAFAIKGSKEMGCSLKGNRVKNGMEGSFSKIGPITDYARAMKMVE